MSEIIIALQSSPVITGVLIVIVVVVSVGIAVKINKTNKVTQSGNTVFGDMAGRDIKKDK